jgi:hypothetical protein
MYIASTTSRTMPVPNRSIMSGRATAISGLVRASRGVQSARTSLLKSRPPALRGGMRGTAIIPAARQPKNATTKSSPGRNTSTARSPGAAFCSSRPASDRALRSNSANVSTARARPFSGRKMKASRSPRSAACCASNSTIELSDACGPDRSSCCFMCLSQLRTVR